MLRVCPALLIGLLAAGCVEEPKPAAEKSNYYVSTPAEQEPFIDPEGFVHQRLADFETFPPQENPWTESDGILTCSGKPKGYLYSKQEYSNFWWKCEVRFVPGERTPEDLEKANTGMLIHIQEPHKVWPASIEAQGRFDEMASLKANGGAPDLTIIDLPEDRIRLRKPVGEWNTLEVTSFYGHVAAYLNGEKICECKDAPLKRGLIGLQSEGFVVEFRNLRIRKES